MAKQAATPTYRVTVPGNNLHFPPVCACCGQSATESIRVKGKWRSVNGGGKLSKPTPEYTVPLCGACKRHQTVYRVIRYAFAAAMELLTALWLKQLGSGTLGLPFLQNGTLKILFYLVTSALAVSAASLIILLPKPQNGHTAWGSGVYPPVENVRITGAPGAYSYSGHTENTTVVVTNEQLAKRIASAGGGSSYPHKPNRAYRRSLLLVDDSPAGLIALSIFPLGPLYLLACVVDSFGGNRR